MTLGEKILSMEEDKESAQNAVRKIISDFEKKHDAWVTIRRDPKGSDGLYIFGANIKSELFPNIEPHKISVESQDHVSVI